MQFFSRICPICSEPAKAICAVCIEGFKPAFSSSQLPEITWQISAYEYNKQVSQAIVEGKNRGRPAIINQLAAILAERIVQKSFDLNFDFVTWVPASIRTSRLRGFDQGRLITNVVASKLDLTSKRTLLRRHKNDRQVGRSRSERLVGPQFWSPLKVRDKKILLVDDVITTGSTMAAASKVLKYNGAQEIAAASIAIVR